MSNKGKVNRLIRCPYCGYENPDGTRQCQNCEANIEIEDFSTLAYGTSGMVTTPTFSTVVDSLKSPDGGISVSRLEEKITASAIRLLLSLGYIYKISDTEYKLTEKGIRAYFENKAFRAEVDKVKNIIKKKYGLDNDE